MNAGTLKAAWGESDADSPILHIDMDAFFAAVEVRDNPQLRGKAVIIGGARRGVVVSATYAARKYGVHSAMPMQQAIQRCPHAIVVAPRMEEYRNTSKRIMEILLNVTPLVEPLSIDEAFLDVSGVVQLYGNPERIAHRLRNVISAQLGLTASIGIAANKFVAKLASEAAKPDGVVRIGADATKDFVQSLPIGALWGVGRRTEEQLTRLGLSTVAAIAQTPVEYLQQTLGVSRGAHLHQLAQGIDDREVTVTREDKSISHEVTFDEFLFHRAQIDKELLSLSHRVAKRLRAQQLYGKVIGIKVRNGEFETVTRSRTLAQATDTAHQIYKIATDLAQTIPIDQHGVRLLGVKAEGLVTDGFVQDLLDLDGALHDRPAESHRKVEVLLDELHQRFGTNSATAATLLGQKGSTLPNKELN